MKLHTLNQFRRYDVIVFGATGFVGQILCRYLVLQFGVGNSLQWAIAGRSATKLANLRSSLGSAAVKLPILVADAIAESTLQAMCAQTRVVISTAGPYALFGEPLVKTCAEIGTDYCDLTGEVLWIRRMLDRYEATAAASGARIVHCCGFDSIPSDVGVYFLQTQAQQRFGQVCTSVKMRIRVMSGGLSGGTVASMMNVIKDAAADPASRKALANPYLLCPKSEAPLVRQRDLSSVTYDADFASWITPFVMASVNTRVVYRTNALSDYAYGREFRYDEAMLSGSGVKGHAKAVLGAAALGGFVVASALPPLRWLLKRFVLPIPGDGPAMAMQEKGFYDLRFIGTTAAGQILCAKVTGDRDPGYGSTAKMLGQAAACLALDIPKTAKPGGFWTPSTIFGGHLIKRLRSDAGMAFEVL
jgi:short subunit dehydrogenase-like uncharacterized protein